jgi:hypothetical protein
LGVIITVLVCVSSSRADAQDWKDALRAEKARNTTQINAIDAAGKTVSSQLDSIDVAIDVHNKKHPNGCFYREGHYADECEGWVKEAEELDKKQRPLLSKLKALADESDRLVARNGEIDRLLRCVPLPKPCQSDSDCNACSSCATFDGRGSQGICQPRAH